MADPTTPVLGLVLPTVGADQNSWGGKLVSNFNAIDTAFGNDRTSNAASFAAANAAAAQAEKDAQAAGAAAAGAQGTANSAVNSAAAANSAAAQAEKDAQAAAGAAAAVRAFLDALIPIGTIVMWSGGANNIPPNWRLCDGTNNTPDIRDKFVIGAGGNRAAGAIGGAATGTPSVQVKGHVLNGSEMPSHSHAVIDPGHSHGTTENTHNHDEGLQSAGSPYSLSPSGATPVMSYNANTFAKTSGAKTNLTVNTAYTGIESTGTAGGDQPHAHDTSASPMDIIPPYYALCFIMRVS